MRKLHLILAALLIAAPLLALPARATPRASEPARTVESWRWQRCRFETVEAKKWTVYEVKLTIRCAVKHWPVSLETAMYVAQRESGFYWHATNSTSGACGIYQHLPLYWPTRVSNFNKRFPTWDAGTSCYNARSNVLVAIWMAHTDGWGPWGM